jgi:hypothetical protein
MVIRLVAVSDQLQLSEFHYTSKDFGATVISTVFGRVEVPNPRWNLCACQTNEPKTFRPMRTWLNGQTSDLAFFVWRKPQAFTR